MCKSLNYINLLFFCLTLTACTTFMEPKPVDKANNLSANTLSQLKNPIAINIYPKGVQPQHPYQVVGIEAISKFNPVGIKRQEATIRDNMRKIAASMGGDAVIDIKTDQKIVSGVVISYGTPA